MRRAVLEWLLEPEQPAVRYHTLTELLGRGPGDPDVREARAALTSRGWVPEILRERDPAGWWESSESLYDPKYVSTHWRMLELSDLGVNRDVPVVRESCELW
ncbi:MAG: nitrogen fixation protein NifH, partial [Thermoplasmata archaeon]